MAKNAMGHGSYTRGGATSKSHHRGVKHPASHATGVHSLTKNRKHNALKVKK